MPQRFDPVKVFALIWLINSVLGLVALDTSGKPYTWANVRQYTLRSGFVALAVSLVWYRWSHENEAAIYFLVGVSMFAGLLAEFVLMIVMLLISKRFKVDIKKIMEFIDEEDKM